MKGDMLPFGVRPWSPARPKREFGSHTECGLMQPGLPRVRGSALDARANCLQLGFRLRFVHQSEPMVIPSLS